MTAMKKEKPVPKLHPSRKSPADATRNVWCIVPEAGVEYNDVLKPEFWAHVAKDLRPGDRVEVMAEDGDYFAELYVRRVGKLAADVAELRRKVFKVKVASTEASSGHTVQWKGPHHRWAVVRESDGVAVQPGFQDKEAAFTWLAANMQSLDD